jgi:DNA-binding transcriptional LysR family regulator
MNDVQVHGMKSVDVSRRLAGLDLNLLHVFHVVYRERSVGRAASLLSVSQSAVSHAIGRLRAQLGDPLFEVRGRGLVPTPMADRLAPAVGAALTRLEEALAGRHEFDPQRDIVRLTVAMPAQLEPLLLPDLVERFTQKVPAVVVYSVRLERDRMKKDLENGVIDAALDASWPNDPELSSESLFDDTLCVVAAPERRQTLDRTSYLAARHIAVSSRRRGPSLVDVLLIREGLRRKIAVRCQRYEAACRIAVSSDMLLTIGTRHANLLGRAIPLNIVPLGLALPAYRVNLYWAQRRDDDPTVLWIRTVLRELSVAISAT